MDKTIMAIVWEADVPYSGEAAFSNPNLLFYANDATKGQTINNLIYNGVAESITLTDDGEGNTDFYCPQSFTAENATVAVTEPVSDRSADYELTASFERMAAQDSVYVLNVGTPRYGYAEGSIFEAGYRDLQPFRAYTRHINSGRSAPPYFALGNLGGNSTTGISSVGDDTYATDVWYDIQGRKLQGRPSQKGVYIQNGRKVIVK